MGRASHCLATAAAQTSTGVEYADVMVKAGGLEEKDVIGNCARSRAI